DQAETHAHADLGETIREHALVAPGLEARERAAHFGMVAPRALAESAAQTGRVLENRTAVRAGEGALEDDPGLAGSVAQECPAERRRRLQLDACFLPPAERGEQAPPVRPRERDVFDAAERRDERQPPLLEP